MKANLTLLKFPHTTDDLINNRIDGLFELLSQTDQDHMPLILEALIWYIINSYDYEGEDYLYQVEIRLTEALWWWKKAIGE